MSTQPKTITVKVPALWFHDYVARFGLGCQIIKLGERLVEVETDRKELQDMFADAEHYANARLWADLSMLPSGLVRSARTAMERMASKLDAIQ